MLPQRRQPSDPAINCLLVAISGYKTAALGLGFGDRFGDFRGRSGSFKEMVLQAEKPGELQGKRATKRFSASDSCGPQMVRRGSTVRVRQRALGQGNACKSASSIVSVSSAEHLPTRRDHWSSSPRRRQSACKSTRCPVQRSTSLKRRESTDSEIAEGV